MATSPGKLYLVDRLYLQGLSLYHSPRYGEEKKSINVVAFQQESEHNVKGIRRGRGRARDGLNIK